MFITSLRHHFLSRRHLRVCKLATEPHIWSASRVFMSHGFYHSPELPKCSSSPQFSIGTRGACAFGKLPLTLSTPNKFCLIMTIRICVLSHFLLKASIQDATNVSPSNLFHCSTGCLIKNFFSLPSTFNVSIFFSCLSPVLVHVYCPELCWWLESEVGRTLFQCLVFRQLSPRLCSWIPLVS